MNVVNQLREFEPSLSAIGGIIEETQTLAFCYLSCAFTFTRREQLAHLLSQNVDIDSAGASVLPFSSPDVTRLFSQFLMIYLSIKMPVYLKKKKKI